MIPKGAKMGAKGVLCNGVKGKAFKHTKVDLKNVKSRASKVSHPNATKHRGAAVSHQAFSITIISDISYFTNSLGGSDEMSTSPLEISTCFLTT